MIHCNHSYVGHRLGSILVMIGYWYWYCLHGVADMHTHNVIHIPATLPIISGSYHHARSFHKAQAYPLLPHLPPLTHAMPELAMGGKPWGQKGGRPRVGGSAKGDVPLL